MQTLSPARERLVGQFLEHWEQLVRFSLNRRARAGVSKEEAELSHAQLAALLALAERDMRMGELATRLGLAESSVTRLVDRLVAGGFMERNASAPDRRCVVAGLTPAGSRLVARVRAERGQFLAEILETLDPRDRREMVRLFGMVADALRSREDALGAEARP
jgi:DNA-binding MarR family transcriptional regulator